jgi:formylglycine-generating enzyme required for sulfatase activity
MDLAGPQMIVGSTFLYADGSVLAAVPGGPFIMGAGGADNPEHQVTLSDFWIYSTKVTNGQYAYCVAMGNCTLPELKKHNPVFEDPLHINDPMVGVNYDQAAAYCSFVHGRLPTEAEWEKAARGPDGNIYPWGDGAPGCDLLNYGTCVGSTTSVNTYPTGRSYYQVFDMEGNTLEWVADWYQINYYLDAPANDPQGPGEGRDRSVRSSAFNSGGNQTQAFNRFHSTPDTQRNNLGFRCVVAAQDVTYFAPFCEYPATYGTDGIGGSTSGPQSVVDCPEISAVQNPYCNGIRPTTNITVSGGPIYTIESTCDQQGNSLKFVCDRQSDFFSACYKCTTTLTSPPLCPQGYRFDDGSKTCVVNSQSNSNTCLPGFTSTSIRTLRSNDPATPLAPDQTSAARQCCLFTPPQLTGPATDGTPVCITGIRQVNPSCSPEFPSCPAGTTFDGIQCISVTTSPMFCKAENIVFRSCTRDGITGDNGIAPGCPVQTCDVNYKWDPSICDCVCDGC